MAVLPRPCRQPRDDARKIEPVDRRAGISSWSTMPGSSTSSSKSTRGRSPSCWRSSRPASSSIGNRSSSARSVLRNPYVDPMSAIQVELLRRWRGGDEAASGPCSARSRGSRRRSGTRAERTTKGCERGRSAACRQPRTRRSRRRAPSVRAISSSPSTSVSCECASNGNESSRPSGCETTSRSRSTVSSFRRSSASRRRATSADSIATGASPELTAFVRMKDPKSSCSTGPRAAARRSSSPAATSAAAPHVSTPPGRSRTRLPGRASRRPSATSSARTPSTRGLPRSQCCRRRSLELRDRARPASNQLTVDLERARRSRTRTASSSRFRSMPHSQETLVEGLDDIARTLKRADAIDAFEATYYAFSLL